MVQWASIEPAPGVFDFSNLDRWLEEAIQSKKKISLGIMAGWFTPAWLYDEDHQVPMNSFNYNRNPQGTALCTVLQLPSPWNPVFLKEYGQAISALSHHLREFQAPGVPRGAAYDAVRIVKLAGINNTTEELRLNANRADNGPCHQSDAPSIWAAAGFTPRKIESAWATIADNIALAFPDKILSVDIIQAGAFPPIDDSGVIYRPQPRTLDSLTNKILAIGIPRFKGKFAVQWDALSQLPPNPAVLAAGAKGAIVAWQMNQILGPAGGSGCFYENHRLPCQSIEDFQSILDNGINLGGKFIEIWAPNVDFYAEIFVKAHNRLKTGGGP